MCKNADNPCHGCRKHEKDAVWMFFTDDERRALETSGKAPAAIIPNTTDGARRFV